MSLKIDRISDYIAISEFDSPADQISELDLNFIRLSSRVFNSMQKSNTRPRSEKLYLNPKSTRFQLSNSNLVDVKIPRHLKQLISKSTNLSYGLARLGPEKALDHLKRSFINNISGQSNIIVFAAQCSLKFCHAHTLNRSQGERYKRALERAWNDLLILFKLVKNFKTGFDERENLKLITTLICTLLIDNGYGYSALWFLNILLIKQRLDPVPNGSLIFHAFEKGQYNFVVDYMDHFARVFAASCSNISFDGNVSQYFLKSLLMCGEDELVIDWLSKFPQVRDGHWGRPLYAVSLARTGKIRDANDIAQFILLQRPDMAILRELSGTVSFFDALTLDSYERAIAKMHPYPTDLARTVAVQWIRIGEPQKALQTFKGILNRYQAKAVNMGLLPPEKSLLLEGLSKDLANAFELRGDLASAADALGHFICKSHDLELVERFAGLKKSCGDTLGYRQALHRLIRLQPSNAALLAELGRVLLEGNCAKESIQHLKSALILGDNAMSRMGTWHRLLGLAYQRTDQVSLALNQYRRAMAKNADDLESAYLLARLLRVKRSDDRAAVIAAYDAILAKEPTHLLALEESSRWLLAVFDDQISRISDPAPLHRADILGKLLDLFSAAPRGELSGPISSQTAAACQAAFGISPAGQTPTECLIFIRKELDSLLASNVVSPLSEVSSPDPRNGEAAPEIVIPIQAEPQPTFREELTRIASESIPKDPSVICMPNGDEGEFYGLSRDGLPVAILSGKLTWLAWTDDLREQWRVLSRDALADVPEEQIHRTPRPELRDYLDQVLNATVCPGRPYQVRDYIERASGSDSIDGTKQRFECFLHGGAVRDAVSACYNDESSTPPRDIDVLTTAPPATAMHRIWALDRENFTQYGYSGMSAHYSSFKWGTTSYGNLDISTIVHDGTLDSPIFMPGVGWAPPVTFGSDLSQAGALRDLTVNCLVWCPKRKWLIELVPNAVYDAIHRLVRPASAISLSNPMLALRALKYLDTHPGQIASEHLEEFRDNAQKFWNQPASVIASFKRLFDKKDGEFNLDLLRQGVQRYGTLAAQHGLGDLWQTHIGTKTESILDQIMIKMSRA